MCLGVQGTEPHVAHLHDSTLTTRLQRPEIADFHTLHFLQALKAQFVGLAPSACRRALGQPKSSPGRRGLSAQLPRLKGFELGRVDHWFTSPLLR